MQEGAEGEGEWGKKKVTHISELVLFTFFAILALTFLGQYQSNNLNYAHRAHLVDGSPSPRPSATSSMHGQLVDACDPP